MPKGKIVDTFKNSSSTRESVDQKRLKWRLQKQKQLADPILRQKHVQSNREYRARKNTEEQLAEDDRNLLLSINERQKKLIANLISRPNLPMEYSNDQAPLDSEMDDLEEFEEESGWIDMLQKTTSLFFEHTKNFHQACGLDPQRFEELVKDYTKEYENLTWQSSPRKNKISDRDLDPQVALKLTLLWMRQYPTGLFLSGTFHVHERTLARVFKRVLIALEATFKEELKWPEDNEFESWRLRRNENTEMEDIVWFIDGTILEGPRSILKFQPSEFDAFFCSHKHKHGVNIQCLVNPEGKVIWNSDWAVGSTPDAGMYNTLGLREFGQGKSFGGGMDGGYHPNRKKDKRKTKDKRPYRYKDTMGNDPESQKKKKIQQATLSESCYY